MHAGLKPSAKCDYCDADFDTKHLICECPALNEQRQWVLGPLSTSLDSSTLSTASPHPPSCVWTLSPPVPNVSLRQVPRGLLDIFTDGSPDPPDIEHLTLSAWAVVMSGDCPDDNFHLVASGPVPGRWQNILLAETYALLVSLQLGASVTIHCDNSTVVHYFRKALRDPLDFKRWRNVPDKDLWIQILNWLVAGGPVRFGIVKVKSHRDITDDLNVPDAWTILGNATADQHAKAALHFFQNSQPPEWKQEIGHYRHQLAALPKVWEFLHLASEFVFQERRELHNRMSQLHPLPFL